LRADKRKPGNAVRIVCISDTHELHRELDIPPGDILIHAGDFMFMSQRPSKVADFDRWLGELPHPTKIVIPGNHDSLVEADTVTRLLNATLLINRGMESHGLKIWGSSLLAQGCLPALLADITYGGMAVANVTDAGLAFQRMINSSISRDEHAQLRHALLGYCEQDTLALVRILERTCTFTNAPEFVMIAEGVLEDGLLTEVPKLFRWMALFNVGFLGLRISTWHPQGNGDPVRYAN
jgi:hypothetical protein